MKVLGIMGGHRRGGNTETLLEEALKGARSQGAETEKVVLLNLRIGPCVNCDDCRENGVCPLKDDMASLYPRLREADRLILSAPVYFRSLPAVSKMMIDRCQSLWVVRYVLKQPVGAKGRKGLFIATAGGTSPKEFEGAIVVARAFFSVLQVSYSDQLLLGGMEDKKDVLKHPTALQDAFHAGARLIASLP